MVNLQNLKAITTNNRFCDVLGDIIECIFWDTKDNKIVTKSLSESSYISAYLGGIETVSPEELELAVHYYKENNTNLIGRDLLLSTVILQNSRIAVNKTPLVVLGWKDAQYNSFGKRQSAQILVGVDEQDKEAVWVQESCIRYVLLGPAPWWK